MSETQVEAKDVKTGTAPDSAKPTVDSIPYARFAEVNDEKNTLKAELDKMRKQVQTEADARQQAELEKKGEFEKIIADLKGKLNTATTKADAFDQYQASRREALLSKLADEDRAIYGDMALDKLESHVEKMNVKVKTDTGKPGKGNLEFSTLDIAKMKPNDRRIHWNDILNKHKG